MLSVGSRAKNSVVGRGNPRLPHQVLGENFRPFQLGGVLAWPKDAQPFPLEDIDQTSGQRLLGSNNGQADPLLAGELHQAPLIAGFDRHILHVQRRARVARRSRRPSRGATASTSSKGHVRPLPCLSPKLSTSRLLRMAKSRILLILEWTTSRAQRRLQTPTRCRPGRSLELRDFPLAHRATAP